MKIVRCAAACFLALVLWLSSAVCAEETQDRQAAFFGNAGQTPEEIILPAMEIYSWFTISPLDTDPELISEDGTLCRVADELLCDEQTIMRLLDFTFSPEIVEGLLAYNTYTAIDGMLYSAGGGRMVDPRILGVVYEETYSGEDRVVYTVTVHYMSVDEDSPSVEVLEFVREPVDGLWVFTQFPFFW